MGSRGDVLNAAGEGGLSRLLPHAGYYDGIVDWRRVRNLYDFVLEEYFLLTKNQPQAVERKKKREVDNSIEGCCTLTRIEVIDGLEYACLRAGSS